jgi:hypothetical protein
MLDRQGGELDVENSLGAKLGRSDSLLAIAACRAPGVMRRTAR